MFANIKITNGDNGVVITETTYEFENDEERAGPVTNAGFYAYTVDYLFRTGKIQDYTAEVEAELRGLIPVAENEGLNID
jgi:hypothetical protein